MKNTLGIIQTGGSNSKLKDLSASRSTSAVPVGGKFRAIDFVLSNMVNSGISNIAVITQYNFRSLMDHLGSGKEWDLDRKTGGLFMFPPYLSGGDSGWYRGSADAMYNNITFLKRCYEKYVLITQGSCVYKMRFDDMLQYHIDKNADITIAYREMNDFGTKELSNLGIIETDSEQRIVDWEEKPITPKTQNGSMGTYILKRELLISLLEESAAHGDYDFVKDILIKKLNTLNIVGYKFDGYWRNLSSIQQYYRCNMELLNPVLRNQLFIENGKIYTKVKDETPAKYNEEADVRNSIVGDGSIIEGTVENSVLFRGVTVKRGAVIRDSIVMQGSCLEENASMQYVIMDKNSVLSGGKYIKGDINLPIIVGKNVRV
ncbi:MAG TPA: glucose-1-phosphate adenylyltransferase subunit GlgD [Clostridia bacterium]|nr:glucose-1-phosphate adenylyltransferase subunit GlgD [Clostridia bacterium]